MLIRTFLAAPEFARLVPCMTEPNGERPRTALTSMNRCGHAWRPPPTT